MAISKGLIIGLTAGCVFAATIVAVKTHKSPLQKEILKTKERIDRAKEQKNEAGNEVGEHLSKIASIIYVDNAREKDPLKRAIEIKEKLNTAIEIHDHHAVTELVGQASQLILDVWSKKNPGVAKINVAQQVAFEGAHLRQAIIDENLLQDAIDRDQYILGDLQRKNDDLASNGSANPGTSPTSGPPATDTPAPPAGASTATPADSTPSSPATASSVASKNPSTVSDPANLGLHEGDPISYAALDDAITITRWMDMGDRAFKDNQETIGFYATHQAFEKYESVARTGSPQSQVEEDIAKGLVQANGKISTPEAEGLKTRCDFKTDNDFIGWCSKAIDAYQKDCDNRLGGKAGWASCTGNAPKVFRECYAFNPWEHHPACQ